jgi:hypothetical protein
MTAAAVVFVCERVFEFVSVCGERVGLAGLGSRDSRTENRYPLAPHELELEHGLAHDHASRSRGRGDRRWLGHLPPQSSAEAPALTPPDQVRLGVSRAVPPAYATGMGWTTSMLTTSGAKR